MHERMLLLMHIRRSAAFIDFIDVDIALDVVLPLLVFVVFI